MRKTSRNTLIKRKRLNLLNNYCDRSFKFNIISKLILPYTCNITQYLTPAVSRTLLYSYVKYLSNSIRKSIIETTYQILANILFLSYYYIIVTTLVGLAYYNNVWGFLWNYLIIHITRVLCQEFFLDLCTVTHYKILTYHHNLWTLIYTCQKHTITTAQLLFIISGIISRDYRLRRNLVIIVKFFFFLFLSDNCSIHICDIIFDISLFCIHYFDLSYMKQIANCFVYCAVVPKWNILNYLELIEYYTLLIISVIITHILLTKILNLNYILLLLFYTNFFNGF